MRHITLPSFDAPPCNGEIHYVSITPPAADLASAERPHRSLPILGRPAAADAQPAGEWICAGCGQKWAREPLPQDAL